MSLPEKGRVRYVTGENPLRGGDDVSSVAVALFSESSGTMKYGPPPRGIRCEEAEFAK